MKTATVAPAYISLYPLLSEIAREMGYALAVHGTVSRDFDLVAVPWTDKAVPMRKLVTAIANACGGVVRKRYEINPGMASKNPKLRVMGKNPERRPHGRMAWAILIEGERTTYIDLSVMPRDKREA